jgi:hypothetical protein
MKALEVRCPCCDAVLQVDPQTGTILTSQAKVKPAPISDLTAEVAKLKGAEARREEVFAKSLEAHRNREAVMDTKFDELLKRAQAEPSGPVKRDIDL